MTSTIISEKSEIIYTSRLFSSGEGMKYCSSKIRKYDLIDSNELIDKSCVLMKYRDEDDISVSSKILSIFEEFYETGITKRISNDV